MNRWLLSGNLTREPELITTPSGVSICKIGVAWNRRKKNDSGEWFDEPHYFNATAFGKTAELIANKASKGDKVFIDGEGEFQSWEAQDGTKRSKVEIKVNSIEGEFVYRKAGESRATSSSQPELAPDPAGPPSSSDDDDDDIPF